MKNTIVGSVVTFGSNSPITITDTLSQKDWEYMQDECLKLLSKMENNKDEYIVFKNFIRLLYGEDKCKISEYIKNHISSFTSSFFTSIASDFFIEIIKGFLN